MRKKNLPGKEDFYNSTWYSTVWCRRTGQAVVCRMNQKNEIEKSIIARSRQSVLVPTFKHHQYWSDCFCETTSGEKITNLSNLERNKVPLTSLSTNLFPKLTIHTHRQWLWKKWYFAITRNILYTWQQNFQSFTTRPPHPMTTEKVYALLCWMIWTGKLTFHVLCDL